MSYSFHVLNGDLNLSGPSGFATVTGTQKLIQDLRDWILEPRGTDVTHPEYGSVIDGGVLPDGTVVASNIGSVIDQSRLLDIEAEIRRVLAAYQNQQIQRLQADALALNGKNTFAAGEVLVAVQDVQLQQFADTILVKVQVLTNAGTIINVSVPTTGAA